MKHSHYAWLAAATHVVASAAMLLMLREGLPGSSEEERLAYIASHRAAWMLGWFLWQIAAISLLAFYATLALHVGRASARPHLDGGLKPVLRLDVLSITALCAAAAGVALDIACESRYMAVLPELRGDDFARLDRELEVLIGYGANGLYTLALVLLVVAGWRVLPKAALALAGPVAASGVALALASLRGDPKLETITSAILFPLFTLWLVVIALWMRKNEESS
ncbi:MAG TPA: hypothetical protein VNI54_01500 [Thermoanaerobaculia bacterium]|nr:hypothetical protein [Thermoanaerobaculia bacterium]